MKKVFLALFGISALIVLMTPTSGFGGSKKKATPPPQPSPRIISGVTGNTVTVSDDKATKTFTITQFTEIYVNGQRGTAAELKPGMVVSVTIGMDPTRAGRIDASGAPPDEGKKKGKKK
jgi:hypothetical protein